MESILDFGLNASEWLQMMYPQIERVMIVVSDFGRFEFYLAILPLIYWCINKRFGTHLAYMVLLSSVVWSFGKHWSRGPRPFWLDSSLGVVDEVGYGLPSGHTQNSVIVALMFALWLRKRWVWVFAFVYIFMIALSRIYLGVHFVHDVIMGGFIGVLLGIGFVLWQKFGSERFRNRIFGQRLLLLATYPLVLLILYIAWQWWRGEPDPSVAWASFFPQAELQSWEYVIQNIATIFGAGVGFTYETNRVSFQATGVWWKRLVRYLLGMVIAVAIWRGLGVAFDAIAPNPAEMMWLAMPLRFVRYTILGLWLAYYAPLVFVALRLADVSAEPDMPFTVAGATLKEGKK